ncbi:MAG: hypothetical protein ABSE19_11760 [Candidatus Acidiferrum sp.]|jgi:hypothetical protein
MRIARFFSMAGFFFFSCLSVPALAQTPPANPALGLVAKSVSGHIGDAAVSEGATVYSGDYLSTENAGSMLIRVGPLSLELQGSSAVHIYRAPYGAIVELNRGTVVYTTPGTRENIVIVASDVRVTPVLSLADLGRVSMDDPCDITVYSQRGQVNVQVGSESHLIEEAKAYRVQAINELSYRGYVSPDASDYHHYHEHRPCAPVQMAKGKLPLAPGHNHFLYLATGVTVIATVWGVDEALESPDRP